MNRRPTIEEIDKEQAERKQTHEIRCYAPVVIAGRGFDQGVESKERHNVPGPEPG